MSAVLERAAALGSEGVLEELERSGLRDRDCENAPTGERLRRHASAVGPEKRVVCDCVDEPELGIARHLLATAAAQVVDAAFVAARVTGSSRLVFHVGEDDEAGAEAVAAAVERARSALGTRAAGGEPEAPVSVELVRRRFQPDLRGYEPVPTLVLTAETLLHISRVVEAGAERYRGAGTPGSPGTKLFQVSGAVNRPGIYELALGTPLRSLIDDCCGGVKDGDAVQAVIVGGVRGTCYRPEELDLVLDFDVLKEAGGTIGSGGVAVLGAADCIVDQAKRRLDASCRLDCGRCSLGREGTYQLREILRDATSGRSKSSDVDMMREIGRAMRLGCACASGRAAPNIVLSSLEKFPEQYDAHMKRRLCRPLVCDRYVTFHILPDLCDGCGECAGECPEDAIEGGTRKIHVIDQDSCERCGRCYQMCRALRQAVVKAGPVKPRTPKKPVPVGSWKG